jgi:Mrp family chromosome partitioning ATPase/uncharacterized protein involved in exopolysaccharide biosynthesis
VIERTILLPPNANGSGHDANYKLTMMVSKRRYLSYLRERWWVGLLGMSITISAMVVYETIRAEKFLSFAQIYSAGNVQLSGGNFFSEESQTYFGTQIELFKSARLQSAALQKAGITLPPGQKNSYKVEVVQPMKTSILQLQATGPDPMLTQRFLQSLIDEYLAYKKETRISTSQDVLDTLNDELTKKAGSLQAEQDKLAEFQKSNNTAVLEEDGKSAGLYLSELNLTLAKARLEQKLLSQGIEPGTMTSSNAMNLRQTNAAQSLASLASSNSTALTLSPSAPNYVASADGSTLDTARLELAVLQGNKDDKIRLMGEHGFEQETARLQRLIAILEEHYFAKKAADLKELEKRIVAVETAIPVWESRVLDINNRLAQSHRLRENVEREKGYYEHLLGTLQNVDLGKNVEQERLSVLQPATPAQSERSVLVLRIVLAGAFGLFLSLAIVFAWYLLDDRFVSVRDIRDQFGENILGLVPQIRLARAKPEAALLADSDARAGYLESYRHLRSALLLSSFGENRPQTLLFTSASAAEGKTTIAINLARLLARSGLRVVLVNADVRGGGMKRLLGGEGQPGVLDYLRGEVEAKAVMRPSEIGGLWQVPCGTHSEQSEGLFLRSQLAELISFLRQQADFVILDGGPILASDATALLVPQADAVVLVTRPFFTQARLLRQALDMLYQRQAKHISIILNRARPDDLAGHYAMNGLADPVKDNK